MSNPSKDKGTAAETAVVKLAAAMGIPAKRVALAGAADQGDVWLWPEGDGARVVVEVKDAASRTSKNVGLPSWTDLQDFWAEAEREALRVPNCDVTLLVVKRPGKGLDNAADWFAFALTNDLLPWEMGSTSLYHGGPQKVPGMWPLGALLSWMQRHGRYLGGAS